MEKERRKGEGGGKEVGKESKKEREYEKEGKKETREETMTGEDDDRRENRKVKRDKDSIDRVRRLKAEIH